MVAAKHRTNAGLSAKPVTAEEAVVDARSRTWDLRTTSIPSWCNHSLAKVALMVNPTMSSPSPRSRRTR